MSARSAAREDLIRSPEFIGRLWERLRSLRGSRVTVLTHVGGDPDSLASSMALKSLLERTVGCSEVHVHVPGEVSDSAARFASAFGIELTAELPDSDHYVAVDVGSPSQLGETLARAAGRLTVIDHHQPQRPFESADVFADPGYRSCSEVVLDLCVFAGHDPSPDEATALYFGTYYDTVRLATADALTLRKVGLLGELGAEPGAVAERLEVPPDYSERIARLKGIKRARLYRCENVIIALTRVSAFRPSVARVLLAAGAGIAVVGDERDGLSELTFRVASEVVSTYSFNVVRDLVNPLIERYGGAGGGHAAAARARVNVGLEEAFRRCVELIGGMLGYNPTPVEE
ncbi:MAG: DHH family phosphoesterase [Aigarchaeota archaeon]|nr:DHH family phosphoesterase [Aigarchaeota archaeon]MCS7127200.1 DHH family phosphoesterase [Candidatus Calditenuaceae archaeon]MDW8042655.1 DHH family phosphoesterase [Nitrososphaerota archaeon]